MQFYKITIDSRTTSKSLSSSTDSIDMPNYTVINYVAEAKKDRLFMES